MEHKDFTPQIKDLHKQIVAEIIALMVEHNVTEVDLLGNDCDHAQVLGFPTDFIDTDEPMFLEVNKVYYKDCQLQLDVILDIDTDELAQENENGDIGDAYRVYNANDFEHICACAGIDSVYEAVFQVLEYDWDDYDEEPDGSPEERLLNAIFGKDKSVFLLDKQYYRSVQVENLTEKDLEEWVAEEDYDDNDTIIKIDANGYDTPEAAIKGEFSFIDPEDYYIFSFGFDIP